MGFRNTKGIQIKVEDFNDRVNDIEDKINYVKNYVAYGSNMDLYQMLYRCPHAKVIGTGVIENYRLMYKSTYATIEPEKGQNVPVVVFQISEDDEKLLDRYEGYPSFYFKQDIEVVMKDDSTVTGMVYIMENGNRFMLPTREYYQALEYAYINFGFDLNILKESLVYSFKNTVLYEQYGTVIEENNTDDSINSEDDELFCMNEHKHYTVEIDYQIKNMDSFDFEKTGFNTIDDAKDYIYETYFLDNSKRELLEGYIYEEKDNISTLIYSVNEKGEFIEMDSEEDI